MRLARLGAILSTVLLGGCFGGPGVETARVMDNFKEQTKDRIVLDRNYQIGQRYRVLPGQVMIRNKLYTLTAEASDGYRAPVTFAMVGDGLRLDIAEGTQFRVSDRILVNGKLANLMPLGGPPPNAPDVQAIFAQDNGQMVPAVLRAGRVASFAKFEVVPDKAQLVPITRESVKSSAGYVNYDLVYNANSTHQPEGCTPTRLPGQRPQPPPAECGPTLHLDLTLMEYDSANPEVVARATRKFYPVRGKALEIPGLRVLVHEATPGHVVYEVTKDDNAFKKKP